MRGRVEGASKVQGGTGCGLASWKLPADLVEPEAMRTDICIMQYAIRHRAITAPAAAGNGSSQESMFRCNLIIKYEINHPKAEGSIKIVKTPERTC
jgi:hypothetical protein